MYETKKENAEIPGLIMLRWQRNQTDKILKLLFISNFFVQY